MGNEPAIFINNSRTRFSAFERQYLSEWTDYVEATWCVGDSKLTRSFGETDEGEAWFVISSDSPEGVKTVGAISINVCCGDKHYVYFCGPRQLYFYSKSIQELMAHQAPEGMFEGFEPTFNVPDEIGVANVVQLIQSS